MWYGFRIKYRYGDASEMPPRYQTMSFEEWAAGLDTLMEPYGA